MSDAPLLAQVLDTAVKHHQAGNLAEAERLYRSVLDQDPNQADALNLLGVIFQQSGDLDQALGLFDRAMTAAPDLATVPFNKANALRDGGRPDEARRAYEAALAIDPGYPDALLNLGALLQESGDTAAAIERIAALLAFNPDNAQAHYNLGKCRQAQGRLEEAENAITTAITLDPAFPDAHFAQANVLADLGKFTAAIKHIETAIKLKPNWAEAYNNWGNYLLDMDRHEEAVEKYEQSLLMDPENMNCSVNRGLALLTMGNLSEGWKAYKNRGLSGAPYYPSLGNGMTPWNGESIEGKNVLVWSEQGLGDEILYASALEECARLTRSCTFACATKLVPIFMRSFAHIPKIRIVAMAAEILSAGKFELNISLVDLAAFFRPSLSAFPEPQPYLKWDRERTSELKKMYRSSSKTKELYVGISWASTNPIIGDRKSVPPELWQPILRCRSVRFFNLQQGPMAGEMENISTTLGTEVFKDPSLDIENDLDSALCQIGAMDLVIACSNTTAHLAGASGVPTWVLVPTGRARLWYWFLGGQQCPWYQNLKLYRRAPTGDWCDVMEKAAHDLMSL